jgi:hypothetical protein
MSKEKSNRLIKLSSQPNVTKQDKSKQLDDYSGEQTHSHKTKDTSAK